MGDPSKVGVNAEFDAIAVVVGGTPFSGGRATCSELLWEP